jgi:hypothetical protein
MSNPVAAWRTRTGHEFSGAGGVLSVDVSAFSVDGVANVTFTATDSVGYSESHVVTDRERRQANYYRTTANSPLTGEVLPRSFDTYGFSLAAEDFASGKITIGCVVTSSAGDVTTMDDIVVHNQDTAPCPYTVYVSVSGDNADSGLTSGLAVQSIAVAVEKLRALNTSTTGDLGGGTIILEPGDHRWCRADDATSPAADAWTSDHWWLTVSMAAGATIVRATGSISLSSPEDDNNTLNSSDNILSINGGSLADQDVNILFLSDETSEVSATFPSGQPIAIDTDTSGDVRMAFEGGNYLGPHSVESNTGNSEVAVNEGSSDVDIQACMMRMSGGGDGSIGASNIQECVINGYTSTGLSMDKSGSTCINVVVDVDKPLDVDVYGWIDTDDVFGNVTVSSGAAPGTMDITFGTGTVTHTSGSDFSAIDGLSALNSGAALGTSASSLNNSGRWGLVLSGFGASNSTPASSAFEVVGAGVTTDGSGNTVGFISVDNASFDAADVVSSGASIRVAQINGSSAGATYSSLYPGRVGVSIPETASNICVENVRLICDGNKAIDMASGATVSRSALINIGDAGNASSQWQSNLTDVTFQHCTLASTTNVTGTLSGCELLRCVLKEHSLGNGWSTVDQCFFSSAAHPAPTGSTSSVAGTWFNQTPTSPSWLMKPLEINLGALSGGSAYSSEITRWTNLSGSQPLTAGVHADFGDALYDDQESLSSITGLIMSAMDAEMDLGSEVFSLSEIPGQIMWSRGYSMVVGTGISFTVNAGEEGPGLIQHSPRGLTGLSSIVLR